MVRIKVSALLKEFIQYQDDPLARRAKDCLLKGQSPDDITIIQIIFKRTQLADCLTGGWILDGFP
jgi:adenylate kinase family enzyme